MTTTSPATFSGNYPIETRSGELERLLVQSEAMAPGAREMLDHIGVSAGWRALDIGCGPGGMRRRHTRTAAGSPPARPEPLRRGEGPQGSRNAQPKWEIFTHGGRKPTGLDAIAYAKEVVSLGAGEILLTSMDRDGTKAGFDLKLTRAISDAVHVPVIASGGVGTLDHLVDGVREGHASAVLAASIFHFGTYTIGQAKAHMAKAGLAMRMD